MKTKMKIFQILGYLYCGFTILLVIGAIFTWEVDIFAVIIYVPILGIIPASIFLYISKLLKKILFLENKVKELQAKIPIEVVEAKEENISLVKCRKCGREYDMDFYVCPYCDYVNLKKKA